jgi:hypothetical protein
MEANTVVLSLPEYNNLRDFKTNLEKGNTYRYTSYQQISNYASIQINNFVTTDEAVKVVTQANEVLSDRITELVTENQNLQQGIVKGWDKEIDKVRKMSIWQFLKWRK